MTCAPILRKMKFVANEEHAYADSRTMKKQGITEKKKQRRESENRISTTEGNNNVVDAISRDDAQS